MIRAFHEWRFMRRHFAACRKLQTLVDKEFNSFRCEDYRRRRKAALKHRST